MPSSNTAWLIIKEWEARRKAERAARESAVVACKHCRGTGTESSGNCCPGCNGAGIHMLPVEVAA